MSWSLATNQDTDSAGLARAWRDEQLVDTDWVVPLSDHPQHAAYMTYRAELRDWPARNEAGEYTNGFPDTRPTIGD